MYAEAAEVFHGWLEPEGCFFIIVCNKCERVSIHFKYPEISLKHSVTNCRFDFKKIEKQGKWNN